ncbi:MAG: HlyD family efflux transporter periplasmic adaptor subunit [Lachnospiraceae bacterium]|nr:HlyD family efflux transporter periplasmic adaptor subunit [Lachnospiraceae bacterium]
MAKERNVIKFRTRREVNIGLVVAFGVLVLLIINIYRYFTTKHLSLYEVQAGSVGSEVSAVAMILRPETVYRTEHAGYLNYYYREGARVTRNAKIYSLNDSSELQDILNLSEENSILTANDLNRLKGNVRAFCTDYSDVSFSECYRLREDFLSDYLRYRDVSMLDTLANQDTSQNSFLTVRSPQSGIISYFSDLYDGYTKEMLTGEEFLTEKRTVPQYSKQTGISAIDSFAYKLIPEETWELVIQVSKESLDRIKKEGTTVNFQILGDSNLYEKPYEELWLGEDSYLLVKMDRYASDYLSERFLDVTVFLSSKEGLKIPETAILEKEVYQIPERFIMHGGGEADTLGVSMECYDAESGAVKPDFYEITPLFYENGYYFVAEEDMDSGQYINSAGTESEPERAMLYSFLTNMEGVYNMNKGYAVFRRIERITDVEDYVLVRAGLAGGVSLYDHIVLDVSVVTKDIILIEGES